MKVFTVNNCYLLLVKSFYFFLFNIRHYLPKVTNIQRCKAELNIVSRNNFAIKQKKHGIFVLLYATITKKDLAR